MDLSMKTIAHCLAVVALALPSHAGGELQKVSTPQKSSAAPASALVSVANLLEARVAPSAVVGSTAGDSKQPQAVIDAVATVDPSGEKWALALVNREPIETVACTVKLGDRILDGPLDATILAGDSPDAFNDVEHPARVVPEKTQLKFKQGVVNLPPHSLSIIRIR